MVKAPKRTYHNFDQRIATLRRGCLTIQVAGTKFDNLVYESLYSQFWSRTSDCFCLTEVQKGQNPPSNGHHQKHYTQ